MFWLILIGFLALVFFICWGIVSIFEKIEASENAKKEEFEVSLKNRGFNITSSFSCFEHTIYLDESPQTKDYLIYYNKSKEWQKVIKFEDIIGMSIQQDNGTITDTRKVKSGAILAGTAGAAVAAAKNTKNVVTRLDVIIYMNNTSNPTYTIELISYETELTDSRYAEKLAFAHKIEGIIKIIQERREK